MNKYQNAKIYKLLCLTTGIVYYGSTTQTIKTRLSKHENHYKLYLEGRFNYMTSFEIIKNNNYIMICILNYPCENKHQLRLKEGEYILNNACINKQVAGRIPIESRRIYYIKNQDKFNHKIVCECGRRLTIYYLNKHKKSKIHLDLINENKL